MAFLGSWFASLTSQRLESLSDLKWSGTNCTTSEYVRGLRAASGANWLRKGVLLSGLLSHAAASSLFISSRMPPLFNCLVPTNRCGGGLPVLCRDSFARATSCVLLADGYNGWLGVSASTRTCLTFIPSLARTLALRDAVSAGMAALTGVFFRASR